jgi:hypothetical protein
LYPSEAFEVHVNGFCIGCNSDLEDTTISKLAIQTRNLLESMREGADMENLRTLLGISKGTPVPTSLLSNRFNLLEEEMNHFKYNHILI